MTSDTPPVFVWHTMEDKTVPVENTLLLLAALRRAGVPCEAHLFEKGAHGTSISTAEVDAADPHRAHWVALCLSGWGDVGVQIELNLDIPTKIHKFMVDLPKI